MFMFNCLLHIHVYKFYYFVRECVCVYVCCLVATQHCLLALSNGYFSYNISLGITVLAKTLMAKDETEASELTGIMIGKTIENG